MYTVCIINKKLFPFHRLLFHLYSLLRHLDSFIKASSGELAPYIGELLCEVFRGGPSITLLVKDEQIWQIVRKIFAKDVEAKPKKMASFLDALIEFAMV